MKYVQLGASGLKVSSICLGTMAFGDPGWRTWALSERDAEPIVRHAAESGVTFFDTADVYSDGASEQVIGSLLRKTFADREDFVPATKVGMRVGPGPLDSGLSRKHILRSLDRSLARLGVDYVDLYQVHRWDPATPVEETLSALDHCVRSGKVRYLGASSMAAWQFLKMQHAAERGGWTPFVAMQNHYNLLYREEEREMLPLCVDLGVGVLPWSPLARGRLARPGAPTATTVRSRDDRLVEARYGGAETSILEAVDGIAGRRGLSPAQVSLAWLLGSSAVVAPVVGATRVEHIADAIASVDLHLSDEERAQLEQPYVPRSTVDQF